MADDDVAYEWKVTWFPPDREQVTKTGSEDLVRRVAGKQMEWNPILERRLIPEWEFVENLAETKAAGT